MIKFENGIFKLDTKNTSYIICVYEENYLLNLYYGKSIPDTNLLPLARRFVNASFSPVNPIIGEHGFSTDTAPMEYGTNGAGDMRISALSIRNKNGDTTTDIRYTGHKIYKGKPAILDLPSTYANNDDECETLDIYTIDEVTGAKVTLRYCVFENADVITRSNIVEATTDGFDIDRVMSLCVDLPSMDFDMITLYGRHNKERTREKRRLAHGIQGIESKRGVTGHRDNNFVALLRENGNEDFGDCYGFNLVYSGNFYAFAECSFQGSTRFLMGINPTDFSWKLDKGESFYTPEAVMVYTDKGFGEMSRIFHRFYNNNLIRGKYKTEKRPLLINSWEAAYFDFDTDKLVSFAQRAKELGIDMLVMDDGWFGKRNDDSNSLGDWYVNTDKLKGGLSVLIDRVNALGLKFGIWYEPEMISPDSDLYRAHPDWCIHVDDRVCSPGRHQYVLDMSREDVRDNIWSQIDAVLSTNKIDYVKWDFNRNISEAGSALLPADRKQEFFHRFILGTYDLMNRLVSKYPNILLENCSGGGGRFDAGMLYYSPQIWTSDNTDPIERLTIQFGTSYCYPASAMGAHVSACRRTGFETKGDVALWGSHGFELDPNKLTDNEKNIVKNQVAEYHKYYDLTHKGDLYRLVDPNDNPYRCCWEMVSADKSECLVTSVTMRSNTDTLFIVKLRGLDENKFYKCENCDEIFSGAILMNAGINLSMKANNTGESIKLYFKEVK